MRIAIVTGANKGIGLETCRALVKSGQFKTVYLTSRNVELGQKALKGTNLKFSHSKGILRRCDFSILGPRRNREKV